MFKGGRSCFSKMLFKSSLLTLPFPSWKGLVPIALNHAITPKFFQAAIPAIPQKSSKLVLLKHFLALNLNVNLHVTPSATSTPTFSRSPHHCLFSVLADLLKKYSMIEAVISIIPSHKIRFIINAVTSTVQRLTAPIIVLSVCVDQTRGNP